MRTLLFLALLLGGGYWYAERRGLALGYPPFLPVLYWNYTGEARYSLRVTGTQDAVKLRLEGELREGVLEVGLWAGERALFRRAFRGPFREELRYQVEPGLYEVRFRLVGAKGLVRYDWVATKFVP